MAPIQMSQLIAQPWWVNLLGVIPALAYGSWRSRRVRLRFGQLVGSAVFAVAFGFVEGMVVVYLRAAAGLLHGYEGTIANLKVPPGEVIARFPQGLLLLEGFREAATIVMLSSVAFLTAKPARSRAAVFLWMFAIWDVVYYAALRVSIGWPRTLAEPDILFLIPVPWLSPVWFPLLVSGLTMAAVLLTREPTVTVHGEAPRRASGREHEVA